MLLDTKLQADESSQLWSIYNERAARPRKDHSRVNSDLTSAWKPSNLLSGMLSLVRGAGTSSEALSYYDSLLSALRFYRVRLSAAQETLFCDSQRTNTTNGCQDSPGGTRSYLRLLRHYGLSLASALVTNVILGMHFPSGSENLSQMSCSFVCELVFLAKEARNFRPLGANYTAPFLNTAWAVSDRTSRKQLQTTLDSHQIDFEVERAMVFSKKLNHSLDSLRSRITSRASSPSFEGSLRQALTLDANNAFPDLYQQSSSAFAS